MESAALRLHNLNTSELAVTRQFYSLSTRSLLLHGSSIQLNTSLNLLYTVVQYITLNTSFLWVCCCTAAQLKHFLNLLLNGNSRSINYLGLLLHGTQLVISNLRPIYPLGYSGLLFHGTLKNSIYSVLYWTNILSEFAVARQLRHCSVLFCFIFSLLGYMALSDRPNWIILELFCCTLSK